MFAATVPSLRLPRLVSRNVSLRLLGWIPTCLVASPSLQNPRLLVATLTANRRTATSTMPVSLGCFSTSVVTAALILLLPSINVHVILSLRSALTSLPSFALGVISRAPSTKASFSTPSTIFAWTATLTLILPVSGDRITLRTLIVFAVVLDSSFLFQAAPSSGPASFRLRLPSPPWRPNTLLSAQRVAVFFRSPTCSRNWVVASVSLSTRRHIFTSRSTRTTQAALFSATWSPVA
mmetsp:Transcript_30431/g.69429  ORF Transcript_30431/g.69429 Transcript_30431/m.69429 type:complete len:236 (-) Transcript_30431:579-1286(-)